MIDDKKYFYLLLVFISVGFSAMMSQIVLLRELIILFTGNELTLGIILGLWLLGTAFGSGVVGRLSSRLSHPLFAFVSLQILMVLLLPLTIVFIRMSRLLFSITTGEIISPFYILLIPFIALLPICTIVGFLYTLGCKLLSSKSPDHSEIPGQVYFFEAIGSGVAGFIASMILFRFLNNFQIATIICSLMILTIAFIFIFYLEKSKLAVGSISVAMIIGLTAIFPKIDHSVNKKAWGSLNLLKLKTTIYGNLAVTKMGDSISFYENGTLLFTHPDYMYAEESVHFAMLEHPAPGKVLLIGGNVVGSLKQILKHPGVDDVDFVLLDPASIKLSQKFLEGTNEMLADPRVNVWFEDGRLFVKETAEKYDVIIINLPSPQTMMINRFYTIEFYQLVRQRLNPNGIISFSIPAAETTLSNEQAEFLSCLYRTLNTAFEDIILIPGYSVHFVACNSKNVLTTDYQILIDRIHTRNLNTKFVQDYYIRFRLSPNQTHNIYQQITTQKHSILNKDFRPIAYFHNIYLWFSSFNKELIGTSGQFLNFSKRVMFLILLPSLLFLFILKYLFKNHTGFKQLTIYFAITIIGATSISLEVLIINGFQAIYGYAYYQVGIIMTGYMIGLALGSYYALHSIPRLKSPISRFKKYQMFATIYPLLTILFLIIMSKIIVPEVVLQAAFLMLIVGIGFIGGHQFPIANRLLYQESSKIEITGGTLYGWDLLGAVVGAFTISTLLIPVFGIGYSCLFFSVLNFVALLILI